MNRGELLKLCRFYKGEEVRPRTLSLKKKETLCWNAERMFVEDSDFVSEAKKDIVLFVSKDDIPRNIPFELSACIFAYVVHYLGGDYPPEDAVSKFQNIVKDNYMDLF